MSIGVSVDASAGLGILANGDGWYSVIAGGMPEAAMRLADEAERVAARRTAADGVPGLGGLPGVGVSAGVGVSGLAPLLGLCAEFGSLRVAVCGWRGGGGAAAEELGLACVDALPRPLLGLADAARATACMSR